MPKIRAGEIGIYFELQGLAKAAPIVFISGLGNDHFSWREQVAAFNESFLCLSFDNRDAGQSDFSPHPSYQLSDMARDTVELMRGLGIDKAHVVGHSMGGAIAQEVALGWPEMVGSLTLLATFARLETWGIELFQKLGPLDNTGVEQQLFQLIGPFAYNWRTFSELNMINFVRNAFQGRAVYKPSPGYVRQLSAVVDHDTTKRLSEISVPTLIVAGEKDVVTPARTLQQMAGVMPQAQFYLIDGASHLLQLQYAIRVNDLLLAHFLDNPL